MRPLLNGTRRNTQTYQLNPISKIPYSTLPPPLAGGGYTQTIGGQMVDGQPPFLDIPTAMKYENGLPINYYPFLITGAVAPTSILGNPDTRIVYAGNLVNNLPPGPYQITPGLYNVYMESPVHRFYQMWQQLNCSATTGSGVCQNDLFTWVEATVGAGSNGQLPSSNSGFIKRGFVEGATAMGFYNVQQGDVPYFKQLADTYSMSDNYHQAVNGGTGANHIMLGTGDAIWFSDGAGNPEMPPHNQLVGAPPPGETPMPVLSTRSRTPTRYPAPTTGTPKTAMAAVLLVRPLTVAAATARAPMPPNPVCRRSRAISAHCTSTRTARPGTITCSTTTIPVITAAAPTLILTA
jgi:phospholipase C